MKKVLISGASGFIGSHLSEKLIEEGFFVVGVDNLITGKIKNLKTQFKFIYKLFKSINQIKRF